MTITHEIEREEVMAYLDGELAAARAQVVRAHLDQCADCRALADELRDVSAGLAEWDVEPSPIESSTDWVPSPSKRPPASKLGWLLMPASWRWSLAGAALVGAMVIVIAVSGRQSGRPAVQGDVPIPMSSLVADKNGALTASPSSSLRQGRGGVRALGYASGVAGGVPGVVSGGADVSQAAQGRTTATTAADNQMIVRTSSISLSTDKFDEIRAALERVAVERHGSVGSLTVAGEPTNQRSMSATLRVPIAEMDAALAGVRALGRVLQESQSSEDVTDAHRDLAIRISNGKVEEARLGEILKDRTGRLSDVLAVEQAQSRVRTEIEQMEAEELAMRNRAALSTISVTVEERYRAELGGSDTLSIGTRLRNAIVDGARAALESLVGVTLALLGAAPTLLLWAAMLFLPVRWVVRRVRRRLLEA